MGATVRFAPGNIPAGVRARERLRAAIGNLSIPGWNDAPERTHAEVLAAFDRAISNG
jgi:hypothetical protein